MRGSAALRTGIAPGGALAGPWVRNPLWTRARAVPSLDLRFADNKSLVDATTGASLVTFTRASSGTFVGSDGLIKTAVTNLLLRSEEFNDAAWTTTRSSVTANAITAPNGTLTADQIIEDTTATNTHNIAQTISFVSGNTYTVSVFAKATASPRFLQIQFVSAAFGSNKRPVFDLVNGTAVAAVDTTVDIQSIGNGWFRCVASALATATVSSTVLFQLANAYTVGGGSATYTGDGVSGLYLWGAQTEQSATVGEYIPTTSTINSAPRFDHNPTTGESLGLLEEEARTNGIRNNTMVGAVAGTPGTTPTNWSAFSPSNGLSRQIVGTGTEAGYSYVDIRYSGTTSAASLTAIYPEGPTQVAAVSGQTWTDTFYVSLVGGSTSNISDVVVGIDENSVAGSYLAGSVTSFTPTSGALGGKRYTHTRALNNALTAYVRPYVFFSYNSGVAIDITLRIGLPQFEQGAFATSVIPTTSATVTRAADVASITGANFSSWYRQGEGTLFAEARTQQSAVGHVLAGFSTGSFASSAYLSKESSNFLVAAPDSAPSNLSIQLSSVSSNVGLRAALAFTAGTGSASAVMDGGTVGTDASTGIPITMSQMGIGTAPWSIGGALWNGTIKRLVYWGQRLPNNVLQAITQ